MPLVALSAIILAPLPLVARSAIVTSFGGRFSAWILPPRGTGRPYQSYSGPRVRAGVVIDLPVSELESSGKAAAMSATVWFQCGWAALELCSCLQRF